MRFGLVELLVKQILTWRWVMEKWERKKWKWDVFFSSHGDQSLYVRRKKGSWNRAVLRCSPQCSNPLPLPKQCLIRTAAFGSPARVCVRDVITGESCDLHTLVPSVSSCLVRELKGWPACPCLKAQILKSETTNCWFFLFVFTLCLSKLFGSVLFPATLICQYFSKPCHYLEL